MATASDLIKSSLRLIGAIAAGETPSASEQADALDALNDILEEWSNDGFMIYEEKIEQFTFTPGTGLYTIGTGATFNTTRPQIIAAAKVEDASETIEYTLKIISQQEWARIDQKDLQSSIPQVLYFNQAFPSGELNFWPVPSEARKVNLYSLKPLTAIASAATTLSYPPGMKPALKYALAVDLAEEYGRPTSARLEKRASDTRAALQRTNTKPVLLEADAFGMNEDCTFNMETFE